MKSTLARVGPLTPTRARRLFDVSVDQTDARKATIRRFGRSDRGAQVDRLTLRSIDPTDARNPDSCRLLIAFGSASR
jgi:hypothetical protein